ncbi:unnamed protein product, partial [Ectocarpus sp. 12 AP-2014]
PEPELPPPLVHQPTGRQPAAVAAGFPESPATACFPIATAAVAILPVCAGRSRDRIGGRVGGGGIRLVCGAAVPVDISDIGTIPAASAAAAAAAVAASDAAATAAALATAAAAAAANTTVYVGGLRAVRSNISAGLSTSASTAKFVGTAITGADAAGDVAVCCCRPARPLFLNLSPYPSITVDTSAVDTKIGSGWAAGDAKLQLPCLPNAGGATPAAAPSGGAEISGRNGLRAVDEDGADRAGVPD